MLKNGMKNLSHFYPMEQNGMQRKPCIHAGLLRTTLEGKSLLFSVSGN